MSKRQLGHLVRECDRHISAQIADWRTAYEAGRSAAQRGPLPTGELARPSAASESAFTPFATRVRRRERTHATKPDLDWHGHGLSPISPDEILHTLAPRRFEFARALGLMWIDESGNEHEEASEIDAALHELSCGIALASHYLIARDLAASPAQQRVNLQALLRLPVLRELDIDRLDPATRAAIFDEYPGNEWGALVNGFDPVFALAAVRRAADRAATIRMGRPKGTYRASTRVLAMALGQVYAFQWGELGAQRRGERRRLKAYGFRRFVQLVLSQLPAAFSSFAEKGGQRGARSIARLATQLRAKFRHTRGSGSNQQTLLGLAELVGRAPAASGKP